jgi:hypothetical protein
MWCSSRCEKAFERAQDPEKARARDRALYARVVGPRLRAKRAVIRAGTRKVRLPKVDDRPTECRHCGAAIEQPARGVRLYCTDACKLRAWYKAHPGYGWEPGVTVEPMPMPYVGHEVFAVAAKAAGLSQSVAYGVDWGQNDIMGEAVLAILEGRDPGEAVRKHRASEKAIDRLTNRRIVDVGWDGKRVIAQYGEVEE